MNDLILKYMTVFVYPTMFDYERHKYSHVPFLFCNGTSRELCQK